VSCADMTPPRGFRIYYITAAGRRRKAAAAGEQKAPSGAGPSFGSGKEREDETVAERCFRSGSREAHNNKILH